jgi:hypothetical protein
MWVDRSGLGWVGYLRSTGIRRLLLLMPLLVQFSGRWATEGLRFDSGNASASREARNAFRMSGGNTIRGNEMSSCVPTCKEGGGMEVAGRTYFERLCVPVFDLGDGCHGAEVMRKFVELFDPVC